MSAVQPDPERAKSPRRSMCAAILTLEAITLGLTTPILLALTDLSTPLALSVGLGLCVLCIVAAGMLRHRWGYVLGWLIQVAAIALGALITSMVALGVIFAVLWWGANALSTKIERERAAAYAEFDRLNAPQ